MSQGDGADPFVGMTGARFGGGGRRRRTAAAEAVTEPLPQVSAAGAGEPGRWPGTPADPRGGHGIEGEDVVGAHSYDEPDGSGASDEFDDDDEIAHIAVRPYVLTGGRTRPAVELAIEALVSVPAGSAGDRRPDHAAVLALCGVPRSIAEIAALMQVALGVARVLVGDLAESGAVVVHRTSGAAGPDMELLERVLGGLHRL